MLHLRATLRSPVRTEADRFDHSTSDADLITMGTRRGDYANSMMGSVSQKVVARSPVPVLTVNLAEE